MRWCGFSSAYSKRFVRRPNARTSGGVDYRWFAANERILGLGAFVYRLVASVALLGSCIMSSVPTWGSTSIIAGEEFEDSSIETCMTIPVWWFAFRGLSAHLYCCCCRQCVSSR
ncbi:hypothetical protein P168DRAFT_87203 [Aspergillus campestris IBT 28561]|uniref:Uncharacterized protein n=1 Tax=Aspergillus campestris (strain IBT 28561) TaxID=1392248 RepID=A0A2I1DB12_ASPC2|nr:uncharacterized protein P168DRAFT_87203 [Aspergillus campestris IBT 28561]PKY07066.1 hypothetical protein P168DRAFT_87203 [Aspergillus campestris IBT 28561]